MLTRNPTYRLMTAKSSINDRKCWWNSRRLTPALARFPFTIIPESWPVNVSLRGAPDHRSPPAATTITTSLWDKVSHLALVRSGMEYASTIWDPHINVHSNKLEKIQRRAARWATSQYSHRTSPGHQCNVPDGPAEMATPGRLKAYPTPSLPLQILHHKVAVPMSSIDLVYNSRPAHGKDTNQSRLQITRASTDQFRKFFGIQTVKDSSVLLQSTISAAEGSEASFKSQLSGSNP